MTDHPLTPWTTRRGQMANLDRTFVESVSNGGYKRCVADVRAWSPTGERCDEETARRIVACVNACAGIPTEALESGVIAEVIEDCRNLAEAASWHVSVRRIRSTLAKLKP